MRINGFSSGLDIDQMVSELMKAHRVPVDKLLQKKQTIEWQRDAYKELNGKMIDYRNNKLFEFKKNATFTQSKLDISGNTAAVTAKTTTGSLTGTLNIKVDNVAVAATKWSSSAVTTAGFDSTKTLVNADPNLTADLTETEYNIKINGTAIKITPATDTMNMVLERINKNTNVTAFLDSSTGKISFSAKETGNINGTGYITFEDVKADPLDQGFLADVLKIDLTPATDAVKGLDANLTINGVVTTRASNNFTVNGVDITLNAASGGVATTIGVKKDVDKIIESVKGFINDYNEMLDTFQKKVNEKKYRDFHPLTDSQKEDMKEKEIELWESKAKSGLLRNDDIFSELISKMRTTIAGSVETGSTKYSNLASIGIETGKYHENGKLYLQDEAKLREALETQPDAVEKMFNSAGDASGKKKGVALQIYDDIKVSLERMSKRVGTPVYSTTELLSDDSIIGKQLTQLDKDIDRGNSRMVSLENMYYKRFSAMEAAMNKYNSQSAYLANAFGGGQ